MSWHIKEKKDMDWRVKAAVQGLLAKVPGGTSVNDLLQRAVGGRRDEGTHIDTKFKADWLVHQNILRRVGCAIQDRNLLEIGAGWLPVFPLCYALAGARGCHTYDLNYHLDPSTVPIALKHLERHLAEIAVAAGESPSVVRSRWLRFAEADSGERILAVAGIHYCAPADATATGLPDDSVDLVFSNSVLEHITPVVLGPMMQESYRLLRTGGLSLHSVNCGDHYAYFDRSITPIHYLRYTERQWKIWNNDILYQNRLRAGDFVAAAQAAQMDILVDLRTSRPDLLKELNQLPIAPEFRPYTDEDLCCTSVTFAARPKGK
jgi:hypothetical protein